VFLGDLFDGLRKIGFDLAQGHRAGDFGAGLLDGLMGQFNRLLNRRIERLRVLFSHDPGLLAQWGQSLAIRDPDSRDRISMDVGLLLPLLRGVDNCSVSSREACQTTKTPDFSGVSNSLSVAVRLVLFAAPAAPLKDEEVLMSHLEVLGELSNFHRLAFT
jgi:hypothetical protein